MQLSYDEIRRIHRLEKNTANLVELEEDFFNSLNEFIREEQKNYIESLKDFSIAKAKNFTNLKKMVEEIFSMREKKLLNKALIASRTNELVEEHMALEEKKVFRQVVEILQGQKKFLDSFFEFGKKDSKAEKEKEYNKVSIKILKEIPSFIGADMKEYGPYGKGETIEIPFRVAKLFIARKLGERME